MKFCEMSMSEKYEKQRPLGSITRRQATPREPRLSNCTTHIVSDNGKKYSLTPRSATRTSILYRNYLVDGTLPMSFVSENTTTGKYMRGGVVWKWAVVWAVVSVLCGLPATEAADGDRNTGQSGNVGPQ